jgi:hypothetical protein
VKLNVVVESEDSLKKPFWSVLVPLPPVVEAMDTPWSNSPFVFFTCPVMVICWALTYMLVMIRAIRLKIILLIFDFKFIVTFLVESKKDFFKGGSQKLLSDSFKEGNIIDGSNGW